jgi:tetratricopeptide (TPR) repeat protein
MIKKASFFLFLSLICTTLSANEPLLDSARMNYDKSDFETAIQQYESVLKKGLLSSDLYYNLGNAYYRNGQLGYCILNYEKALKLNPSHENTTFNLALVKAKRMDKFDEVPQFSFTLLLIGANKYISHNYSSIIGSLLILISALVFIYGKKAKVKKFINYSRIGITFGFIITLITWKQQTAVKEYKNGIVVAKSSNIFSEPNPNSTLLFEIHEGVKLEFLSESNGWVNIKTPANEIGWIEDFTIESI